MLFLRRSEIITPIKNGKNNQILVAYYAREVYNYAVIKNRKWIHIYRTRVNFKNTRIICG
jgi:hypothetical protein